VKWPSLNKYTSDIGEIWTPNLKKRKLHFASRRGIKDLHCPNFHLVIAMMRDRYDLSLGTRFIKSQELHLNNRIFLIPAIRNSFLVTPEGGCRCFEYYDVKGKRRFATTSDDVIAGELVDTLPEVLSLTAQVKD
jgi:hypothetical protein